MTPTLEVAGLAVSTVAAVARRRLASGPLRPSWSLRTELFGALMRGATDRSRSRGIAWLRAVQAAVPVALPRALASVRFDPVTAGGVPCAWARPPDAAPGRAIVYLHGGGYVIGSIATHREIVARLAHGVGVPVLSVDYRLAPEHRFPAAHDDCLTAVRWLSTQGVPATGLALAGDSAGGALTIATMLSLRDAGRPLPACAVLLSPWTDPLADGGTMRSNAPFDFGDRDLLLEWIGAYADASQVGDPRLTPARAALHGLPPLLVQVGEAEMFLDQVCAFAARARAAGVAVDLERYADMYHDWQLQPSLVPDGTAAVASMVRFLAAHLCPERQEEGR